VSVLLQYRFVFVIALLAVAAALLTDRNRLPLALRGLRRTLGCEAQASASRTHPVAFIVPGTKEERERFQRPQKDRNGQDSF
jgi:hypothetical protein